jgi:phosphonate transport system substrate-binding protein
LLRRRFVLIAACGALLTACQRETAGDGPGEAGLIRFVMQGSDADKDRWAPLFSDLRTATGLRVRPGAYPAGAAIDDALHHRRADIALAPGAAALVAVRRGDAEVFARLLPSGAGAQSVVLVADSATPLSLPRILKCDRSLSFGAPSDGKGEALLAAEAYLLAPGGTPISRCFRQTRSAPADSLLAALSERKLDTAILSLDDLTEAESTGKAKAIRALWRSPPLPSPCLVWRRDLDPAVKEKLRQFLLTYGQGGAAQRQRLAALGLAGFAAADNAHLLVEREMEAAHAWLEARASGDQAREIQAKAAFDAVTAERADLEARTGSPAGLQ